MNKIYAGIGARKTPQEELRIMRNIGAFMAYRGWMLRSGAADGADTAFEHGCNIMKGHKEIFLPWNDFNERNAFDVLSTYVAPITSDVIELSAAHHPAWNKLSTAMQKLMIRNAFQVLGKDLNKPVDVIICWTPDGRITGGTGQALRIANSFKIPVINLGNTSAEQTKEQLKAIMGE